MSTNTAEPADILIVDDHTENLISMEAVLASPDVRLVLSRSGPEALRAVLEHDFALILLDVQMPGMDGFETAELIRQRERSRHTPIIFVTAINKSERNMFQGYSFGAVDYIFKPFMPEVLKSKVDVFVTIHRMTSELQRQKDQLERVNQEFETFSRAISGDLQAALSRITTLSETFATVPEQRRNDVLGLKGLLASLADFSKTGSVDQTVPLPLDVVCGQVVSELRRETRWPVEWIVSELPQVRGDPVQFEAVFRNLLVNMVRLTAGEPSPRIEIGSYSDNGNDIVFLKENGRTLDADDVLSVVQGLGTAGSEGLGLSFAVAQKIVRRLGGQLWARAGNTKGSTIFFSIPQENHRGED